MVYSKGESQEQIDKKLMEEHRKDREKEKKREEAIQSKIDEEVREKKVREEESDPLLPLKNAGIIAEVRVVENVDMYGNIIVYSSNYLSMDPYKITGLQKDNTPKEIGKACKKLIAKNHPDKSKSSEKGSKGDIITKINNSCEVLKNAETKDMFDKVVNKLPMYQYQHADALCKEQGAKYFKAISAQSLCKGGFKEYSVNYKASESKISESIGLFYARSNVFEKNFFYVLDSKCKTAAEVVDISKLNVKYLDDNVVDFTITHIGCAKSHKFANLEKVKSFPDEYIDLNLLKSGLVSDYNSYTLLNGFKNYYFAYSGDGALVADFGGNPSILDVGNLEQYNAVYISNIIMPN